jgi:hypothetical protein
MRPENRNPVALAGADRADVKMLPSNLDIDLTTPTSRERQARYIRRFCSVSLPVALVIAEHAFGSGRRA